jgi:hypothetical protein
VGLFIALGCGGLILFGAASAVAAWYIFTRTARTALERLPGAAASALSAPAAPTGIAPPTTPTSDAPAVGTGGAPAAATGTPTAVTAARPAPSASSASSAAPGGVCAKAIACCRLLMSKTPGGGSTLAGNCDNLKILDEQVCARSLQNSQQLASVMGVSCN